MNPSQRRAWNRADHDARRLLASRVVSILVAVVALAALAVPVTAQGRDRGADDQQDAPRSGDDAPAGDQTCDDSKGDGKRAGGKQQTSAQERNGDAEDSDCPPPEPPPPPVPVAGIVSPVAAAIDVDLEAGLASVGFLDTWHASNPTHPRLSLLLATGAEDDPARRSVLRAVDRIVETREDTTVLLDVTQDSVGRRRVVERQLTAVDERLRALARQHRTAEETLEVLLAEHTRVVDALRQAAVGMYVSDHQVTVTAIENVGTYNSQRLLAENVDATIDELLAQRSELEQQVAHQQARLADLDTTIAQRREHRDALVDQTASLTATIDRLTRRIGDLTARRVKLEAAMPTLIADAHLARLGLDAPGADIGVVAIDAYVRAAEKVVELHPSCAIRWEVLAGIATIESRHGTMTGGVVGPDGVVSTRVLGPVLDGTLENTAIITDSDGGRLDGDAAYDRAVGPFQFIPSTWASHALDGDDDGVADPHNMYDAALSAAGYLCTSSNVASDADIGRSVLSYNHSGFYLADVTRAARAVIDRIGLPEPAYDPDTLEVDDPPKRRGRANDDWQDIGHVGRTRAPAELAFTFDPALVEGG